MLEILKFVQGAVAKKDFVPALQHFRIDNAKILGFNGSMALCSPIDLNLTCSPKAVPFIKAIQTCKETVELHMTPAGKLAIRSGPFKAFIDCMPEESGGYPNVEPEGADVEIDGAVLMESIKQLGPFIAEDASRPWARGVLFRGQSAFATNNIIIVEKWVGSNLPEVNIPCESVAELLRIGEAPTKIQTQQGSITFSYSSGRWLRSQLLTTEWPDVSRILDRDPTGLQSLPEGFFVGLENLRPFIEDGERVYFGPGRIGTTEVNETGAHFDLEGLPGAGCFNLKQLQKLEGVIDKIDFSTWPKETSMFYGPNIRGAIAGIRI